jgi:Xaa-Pro aminopeptidase
MPKNTINESVRERVRNPISDAELERRYDLISKAMKAQDVDLIIASNDNMFLGGYVRYLLDTPGENAYPLSAMFTKEGDVFSIFSANPATPYPPEWGARQVKERFGTPYFRTLDYTGTYDAKVMVDFAKKIGAKRIGLVAPNLLSSVMVDYIRENSGAEVVNFTRPIDEIKAVKSEEELQRVYQSAKMHDKGFEFIRSILRPGMYEYEVYAEVKRWLINYGSEESLLMQGSATGGTWTPFFISHFHGRQIKEGDDLLFMIEASGPGGYYTEVGRTFCLGEPSRELVDIWETSKRIQHQLADALKPGVKISDMFKLYDRLVLEAGFPEERRLLMHGQGYDLVEWPGCQPDDEGIVQENMVFAIHPHLNNEFASGYCCDDYLVTKDGAIRLHKLPQELLLV